jgi:hypothetical protein
MAHIRYLFPSQIANRVDIRKKVYQSLVSEERDRGVALHWNDGEKELKYFYAHSSMLRQKNTNVSNFNSIERKHLFDEQVSLGIYVKKNFYIPKVSDYKLLETRFDLTDIFPELINY